MPNDRVTEIFVKHNIEVAHRLLNLPGKCQQIHGHSMLVTLTISTTKDENGYALGADGTPLDFGSLKRDFRGYLDEQWDHHLHLNIDDPLAGKLQVVDRDALGRYRNSAGMEGDEITLPGLVTWPGDPSVENIAEWIRMFMQKVLGGVSIYVKVEETRTNGAAA